MVERVPQGVLTKQQSDLIKELYPNKKLSLSVIAARIGLNPDDPTAVKYISTHAIHELGLQPRRDHFKSKKAREEVEDLRSEVSELKDMLKEVLEANRPPKPVWKREGGQINYGEECYILASARHYEFGDELVSILNELDIVPSEDP